MIFGYSFGNLFYRLTVLQVPKWIAARGTGHRTVVPGLGLNSLNNLHSSPCRWSSLNHKQQFPSRCIYVASIWKAVDSKRISLVAGITRWSI
jgi:hypothetical protein